MDVDEKYTVEKEKVVYRIIGEAVVLLETETGRCYSFNGIGTEVWVAIEQGSGVLQISRDFASRYEIGIDRLKSDIAGFCKKLEKEKLIRKVKGPASKGRSALPRDGRGKPPKVYHPPAFERYDEIRIGRSVA